MLDKHNEGLPGITAALASSYLCANTAEASVGDCFWSNEVSQGISVSPKQLIYLNPFITFPQAPSLIPFKFTPENMEGFSGSDVVYTLIETDLLPVVNRGASGFEVGLE
jgi:hypothetical protein